MPVPKLRIHVYEAPDGWRWKAIHRNGNVMADGSEAYDSERNVRRALRSLAPLMEDAIKAALADSREDSRED